ncbi:hypothetical protein BDB01DRAFT_588293 [Pilobolus umbonatus]|nr:hypothetical protein BDB01DRAFT_588293 [Pilobolus umbonatus]
MKDSHNKVQSELESYKKDKDECTAQIQILEGRISDLQLKCDRYKRKLGQSLSIRDEQLQEINEKFMLEARRNEMTMQAQLANLNSEHTELLRELKDQHEQDKEMWKIEEKSKLDQLTRDLQYEKDEAIKKLIKEWRDKHEDLSASMSQDALKTQEYWQSKLEKAEEFSSKELTLLRGQIEVVKDRLMKEITRRKEYHSKLLDTLKKNEELDTKVTELSKNRSTMDNQLHNLMQQFHSSHRLSLDILAVSSPQTDLQPYYKSTVADILYMSLRNLSIMQSRSQLSCYDHDMIYA